MKQVIFFFFAIAITINCFGHGGGTDKNGGHHDRQKGGYHFHHGIRAHQHPNGICELSNKSNTKSHLRETKSKDENTILQVVLVGLLGFGAGYALKRKKN